MDIYNGNKYILFSNDNIKPENYDSIKEYVAALREKVQLEPGELDKMSREEQFECMALSATLHCGQIGEEKGITITNDFVSDLGRLLVKHGIKEENAEEFAKSFNTALDGLKSNGFDSTRPISDYLKGTGNLKPDEVKKTGDIVENTFEKALPNLSKDEIGKAMFDASDYLKGTEGISDQYVKDWM